MRNSPPESLLDALKKEDADLRDFVWLNRSGGRQREEAPQEESCETDQPVTSHLEEEEARAKHLAEVRRRVEEQVARRKSEAKKEKQGRAQKTTGRAPIRCARCQVLITKGLPITWFSFALPY